MKLISTIEELRLNLETVECYLSEGAEEEEVYTKGLIHRGNCFVAYKISGELRFAPSRFIGYKTNDYIKHANSNTKDGRETNIAIGELLGGQPTPNPTLEEDYFSYCNSLGIFPKKRDTDGRQRKFWILDLGEKDFDENIKEGS
jgi:5-methylcytosine-specific restriction protein A